MAKKQIDAIKNANSASIKRSQAYAEQVRKMFAETVNEILELQKSMPELEDGQMFSFDAQPIRIQKEVEVLLRRLSATATLATQNGIKVEWDKANDSADSLLSSVMGKAVLRNPHFSAWTNRNQTAMQDFITRKEGIMTLSDRIWQTTRQLREEMEVALTVGIGEGKSSAQISRDVRKYLNDPDLMFRRFRYKIDEDENGNPIYGRKWKKLVKDEDGKKHWIDYDKNDYKVGAGMYKSSAKNAMRVARTETNMAYKRADQERYKKFDFILGYHIEPSHNHEPEDCEPDICEQLKGDYPKWFTWEGWHPQCYSDDSEVYTSRGWKLFKDVNDKDLILSLNPGTRNVEWVSIIDRQEYERKGDMIRFFNKSLDILVTPDHSMVYLSKSNRNILRCEAENYKSYKGAIYRSCEYDAEDVKSIEINGKTYDFDAFCEFMGYWLADGSLERTSGVNVAHQDGRSSKAMIFECAKRLGYDVKSRPDKIVFYDVKFNTYLRQFGHAECKFVPDEIKNASKRQINIFLDAFAKCDAHIRQSKSFVGNHGHVCKPKTKEVIYFTSSERMASDLSECILKVGMRPSFNIQEPQTAKKKDGSVVKSNYRCWRISKLKSVTATVFDKETVSYDGKVYDLSLEKNHIMYIRRIGKCFWGSNCKCQCTPIMLDEDEALKMFDARANGKQYTPNGMITEMPQQFKDWCVDNEEKIVKSHQRGKDPYFVRHNFDVVKPAMQGKDAGYGDMIPEPVEVKKTPLETADERHANRTKEQKQILTDYWNTKTKYTAKANEYISEFKGIEDTTALQEAKANADWDKVKAETLVLAQKKRSIIESAIGTIKDATEYGEVDTKNLYALMQNGKLSKIQGEIRKVNDAIIKTQKEENAISDLIPNAHLLHNSYKMVELQTAHKELNDVLDKWLQKYHYTSLGKAPLDHLRNKLEFEISNPTFRYANNEIIKKALTEKVQIIASQIEWNELINRVNQLKQFTSRSVAYKASLVNIDTAIQSNDRDALRKAIEATEKIQQTLLQKQIKRSGSTAGALNKEYKGGAVGSDISKTIDVSKMVSEDPYNSSRYTNNIARLQGFDAPAKLVTETEFDQLEKASGEVFYRTVNPTNFKGKQMSSQEFASQLYVSDLLEMNGPGGRVYGDGLYVATSSWDGRKLNPLTARAKLNAYNSSMCYGNGRHTISEMTWTRPPKIIKQTDLKKMWDKLPQKTRDAFGGNNPYNMNTYGCALGYDAMLCDGPNYMVIWNRSIIAVKKK